MFRICWHNWSGWSAPIDTYNSNKKDQFRVCTKCSQTQSRTFGHSVSVSAKQIADGISQVLQSPDVRSETDGN